jgi:carbon storage regulator
VLFLTRKIGESVIINSDIEITIQEITGSKVKLGIVYPKTASVLRKEIFERIQEENQAASLTAEELQDAIRNHSKIEEEDSANLANMLNKKVMNG